MTWMQMYLTAVFAPFLGSALAGCYLCRSLHRAELHTHRVERGTSLGGSCCAILLSVALRWLPPLCRTCLCRPQLPALSMALRLALWA